MSGPQVSEERAALYIGAAKRLYENRTVVFDDEDIFVEDDVCSVVEDEYGAYVVALVRVPKSEIA